MKIYLLLLLVPSLVFAFGSGTTKQFDQIENNTGTDIVLKPVNDVKIDTFSGAFVLQSGTLKEIEESSVSNTELSYLSGSTSNIQTQIDSKTPLIRLLTTTAPLLIDAGASADLSADRTLSISVATAIADGYLSLTDWNTFNNKTPTARLINTTSPIIGGGDLTADRTISIPVATTGVDGYLSSTDWNTFNNKSDGTGFVDTTTNQSIAGIKTFTGQLVATSTTNGFHPAPTMTEAQRDLITGEVSGDLIFNSDTGVLNIFDGADWIELAGGGGAGGSRLNLVEFPSFEDDITEGTCTNCSRAAETTEVLTTTNNITSLKITATAASADYTVDKNTSAQWNTGMGILKSAWIKTSADDVKIISRVDGADETVELDIVGDGNWRQYKIPTKSGTTSNGYKISIPTDTSIVYVDETEIKPNDEIYNIESDVTDWETTTCTGTFVTNATYTCLKKIVGDDLTVKGQISFSGATNVTALGLDIPDSMVIDAEKLVNTSTINKKLGTLTVNEAGVDNFSGSVTYGTSTSLNGRYYDSSTTSLTINTLTSSAPSPLNASDVITFEYTVPIIGLSSTQSTIVTQTTELDASISNHLSGRVSSAGSLQSTDYDWISSTTNPSTGNYTVNFKAGIFTVNPSCNIKGLSGTRDCTGQGGTGPASWSVKCFNSGTSTLINTDFFIQCDKQGIDVNKSATIVGKFENINSSDLVKVEARDAPTSTSVTAGNPISFVEVEDNYNAWDGDEFTAPKDSWYLVTGNVRASLAVLQYMDGKIDNVDRNLIASESGVSQYLAFKDQVFLLKDQVYHVRSESTFTMVAGGASPRTHWITISELPDTSSIIKNLNDNKKIECEKKRLSASVTSTGVMTDLTFTGIENGAQYLIRSNLHCGMLTTGQTSNSCRVVVKQNLIYIGYMTQSQSVSAATINAFGHDMVMNNTFTATSTGDVTFDATSLSNTQIIGNTWFAGEWVELCKLNDNYVNDNFNNI